MMQNLDAETLRKLDLLKNNLPLFAKTCLKVVTAEGDLKPFIFNESQIRLHEFIEKQKRETGMVRIVVSKGRKQGVSTYTAARFFHQALFNSHKTVFILSHISSSTNTLFGMVAKFYENLPPQLKLKLTLDNSKSLGFENGSKYTVGTAGAGEIGRGDTPQYFHASECASYEDTDALETGIFRAVATVPGTEIIIESTAKGIGNMFHRYAINALEGRSRYRLFFLPWYIHSLNNEVNPPEFNMTQEEEDLQREYGLTNGQIYWRRLEMQELSSPWKFKQEYPFTVQEAFQTSGDTLYSPELIHKARKSQIKDPKMPLIIGVDPARSGDRTTVVHRRGRVIEKIKAYKDMDEMQLAGILANEMNEAENLGQVFIDVAHGYGTIDRLRELNFGKFVTGVHFSAKPFDPNIYANKRSEMAFTFKDWLADGEVSLPDDDDMEMDILTIPDYKESSTGRILLEAKEKIKQKYGKSPDIFDGIILTFAYPVRNPLLTKDKEQRYNGGSKRGKEAHSSPVMKGFNRGKRN